MTDIQKGSGRRNMLKGAAVFDDGALRVGGIAHI